MPFKHGSPILDAFKTVFNNCDYSGERYTHICDAQELLMDKYGFSATSVEVMALLMDCYPLAVNQQILRNFIAKKGEYAQGIIQNLIEQKFIVPSDDESDSYPSFRIHEDAYKAFCADEDYDEYACPVVGNCLEALKACRSKATIYSEKWIKSFNLAMQKPENQQFRDACDTLQLWSYSIGVQQVFWEMAWQFVHFFNTGLSVIEGSNEDLGRLIKDGLVISNIVDNDSNSETEHTLASKVVSLLFHGHEELIRYNQLSKYASIIKCGEIKKKELFFSEEAQCDINNLRKMLSPEGYQRAMTILTRDKRPLSILSLLWGPPGTGKTEVIKQLALESGRDIIQYDASKVVGGNWGATEKSYLALFRAYDYVAVISERPPIFLLNEADDLLSKRLTHMDRAIDKSYNTVSNIMLQVMENFNGILLATTNLIDNLDDAFGRRFLFKTRLIKPNAEARAKIWKSYIPELTDSESISLAVKYEMSGAQIDNVTTKRNLAELYYEGDRGFAFVADLCEKELAAENGSKSFRTRIGY